MGTAGSASPARRRRFWFSRKRAITAKPGWWRDTDRKSTRLNSSHRPWAWAVACVGLALVWMKRGAGESAFVQPIAPFREAMAGKNIFVIGHPERFFFSLSTGIVMRAHEDTMVQISAPVSPGNSGGPVYDDRGELLGVVSYKVDRRFNPNAENLNFAVRADALLDEGPWDFRANGKELLASFKKAHTVAFGPMDAPVAPAAGQR